MLLIAAATLFALGALGGLIMAISIFKGKAIPAVLAAGHGLLGATGLVLLIVGALFGTGGNLARISLGVLIIAALGGFYLLSFHIRKQAHPRAVVVVHALVAATGFLCLLVAILQTTS